MNLLKPHPNEKGTYIIIDIETDEIMESFRLKTTALVGLQAYNLEQRKTLEVRKVK